MGRSSSFFHLFFRASRPESRASLATMLNVEFTDISTVEGEVPHVTPNPILLARSPLPLPLRHLLDHLPSRDLATVHRTRTETPNPKPYIPNLCICASMHMACADYPRGS